MDNPMDAFKQRLKVNMDKTTITMHGSGAIADGAVRDLIVPLLEHTVRRFFLGGPQGCRHRPQVVRHYGMDDDGNLIFSAGLVRRIRRHLERHGYLVQVDNRTFWGHLHDADHSILDDPELSAEDVRLLSALAKEPRGQVLVRRTSELGRYIALFGRLFSNFNIDVVARNKNRVRQLVDQIGRHTDRPVTSDSRAVWSHNPRLFVGTMQLFHHSMAEGFHVLIFTDVESVLAARTANIPVVWQDGTWYAFLESHEGLSDYELFRLEEVCGPVIFAPIENQQVAKVNVSFAGVHRTNDINALRGLARKRALYWHSPSWNGTIASMATTLACKGCRQTVSILVETTEHGRELLKWLPGWELLTANSFTSCIPAVDNQQIATFTYAEHWGIGTDVLIRADGGGGGGGGGGWPLSTGFPRWAQREDAAVLLIDFTDAAGATAVRDTQSRRAAYKQLGWDVVPVEGGWVDSGQVDRGTEGGNGQQNNKAITSRRTKCPDKKLTSFDCRQQ